MSAADEEGLQRTLSERTGRSLLWLVLLEGVDISDTVKHGPGRSLLSRYAFVDLRVGTEAARSGAVRLEKSPEWNEQFCFMVESGTSSTLRVSLCSQEGDVLAGATVELGHVAGPRDLWVPLLAAEDGAKATAGELHFQVRKRPLLATVPPGVDEVDEDHALVRSQSFGGIAGARRQDISTALRRMAHSGGEESGVTLLASELQNTVRFVASVSEARKLHWLRDGRLTLEKAATVRCLKCGQTQLESAGEKTSEDGPRCEHIYCVECLQASESGTVAACACWERSSLLFKHRVRPGVRPLLGELGQVTVAGSEAEVLE